MADIKCTGRPDPYGYDREAVTESQAAAWWPYRPLLRGEAPETLRPQWLAYTQTGGTRGDPTVAREEAGLSLVYENPRAPAKDCSVSELTAAGGIILVVNRYNSAEDIPTQLRPIGEPQMVRGHQGTHTVANEGGTPSSPHKNDPHDDTRLLRWTAQPDNGTGILVWGAVANAHSYSREQLVAIANGLQEVH